MFKYTINDETHLSLLDMHHAAELFALIDHNRSHLREWLPWVEATKKVEDTKSFIEGTRKQFATNNGFQTCILYKGHIAGVIGFHDIDWQDKKTEIGYWLGESFQGRGLMTKAVRALVEYAFGVYELNRVEIMCAIENMKSRAIPERLGFHQEGIIREGERLYGQYVDLVVYGILAKEWKESIS